MSTPIDFVSFKVFLKKNIALILPFCTFLHFSRSFSKVAFYLLVLKGKNQDKNQKHNFSEKIHIFFFPHTGVKGITKF